MNEANFFIFFLYIFDLHNWNIEGKLACIVNPKSESRYEHIEKMRTSENSCPIVSEQYFDSSETNDDIDSLAETLEELTVHDTRKYEEVSKLKCNLCGAEYKQVGYLNNHINNKHGQKQAIKCNICSLSFESLKALNRHKKTNHCPIICQWCNTECDDKASYNNHLETHVKCDMCVLTFDTHNKFKRHMKTHS